MKFRIPNPFKTTSLKYISYVRVPLVLFGSLLIGSLAGKASNFFIQKEEAVLEKYKNIKIGLMARLLTPPEDAEIIDETGE